MAESLVRHRYRTGVRYLRIGNTRVSVIGLGTWQFGSREWRYGPDYASRDAPAITRRALDLGMNLVDTAEIYGFGRSERIVGRAIADRRSDAFVATKLYPALPLKDVVMWRAERSARRLGVEHIDLYQLHALNPVVPLSSTMRGMAALQQSGLVHYVGVSNLSLTRWQEAEAALGGTIISNQVRYSLAVRSIENELLPWAQSTGRFILAFSPLAQGLLSGRYDSGNRPRDVRRRNPLFLPEALEAAPDLLGVLRAVARSHGATPAQVALAWLVQRPNVLAIAGARNIGQLEENAAAADLTLTEDDDRSLREAADRFRARVGNPMRRRDGLVRGMGRAVRVARAVSGR